MVEMRRFGAQRIAPLPALGLGKTGLLRQFLDPATDALGAQQRRVRVENTVGQGIDHHHRLPIQAVRVLQAEIAVEPDAADLSPSGATANQGEEQRGFLVVTACGLGQGTFGQLAFVREPSSQCHQRRGQPVARSGKHQFFGSVTDGFLAYQLNVGGLQDARGLAAHDGILAEFALDFLADFDLACFSKPQLLGLEIRLHKVVEGLL